MPRRSHSKKRERDEAHAEQTIPRGGPRAMWSGTITFGLVSVPVDLYPGHSSVRVPMRMLDSKGHPLSRRYCCPREDRPVDNDELVRGYPVGRDQFVVVTDEELESLSPDRSREIDLREFVPRDQLDPMLLERSYYLVPSGDSTRPYQLLTATMEQTGRVGIATFVMRGKEYVVAILAEDGILRAETLRHHDEIRSEEEVGLDHLPKADAARVEELTRVIESMRVDSIDENDLRDERSEALLTLAREKYESGQDVVEARTGAPARPDGAEPTVVDLMQALKQRLAGRAASGGGRPAGSSGRAQELREASKGELYERAKKLDIEGRSKMTKDELIQAIQRSA